MVFRLDIEPGDVVSPARLVSLFQCQQGKGMRCSRATNTLVLVIDHTKKSAASIYADQWDADGILHYRGTGLRGDQSLDYEGNRWLRDAKQKGTGVYLFEKEKAGLFKFVGRVSLVGEPYRRREPDIEGEPRWVWVFPLRVEGEAGAAQRSAQSVIRPSGQAGSRPAFELSPQVEATEEDEREPGQTHEQIQGALLEMGGLLGLDVWVARNDRNRSSGGRPFADFPRMRESLPRQFEQSVMAVIEHIDVLWLRGNRIEAAFEVEHTTSVYSGLLRMSDLVTLHPNILIRLYIVAPDARRSKVLAELVRPTFDGLEPPLKSICGYIAYSRVLQELAIVRRYRDQLKPGFLNEIAEYVPREEDSFKSA